MNAERVVALLAVQIVDAHVKKAGVPGVPEFMQAVTILHGSSTASEIGEAARALFAEWEERSDEIARFLRGAVDAPQ